MSHHESAPDKHPKQDFQVERLAFFSDAVFAIAITLLVIEFRVPHITEHSTYKEIVTQLQELWPHALILLFTYFMIAVYWVRHHSLFKYIHNYNTQLVVANVASLLPIILFPFSSSLLAAGMHNKQMAILGYQVFFANHVLAGVSIYAIYWFGMVRHKHLSYDMPLKEKLTFYEQTLYSAGMFVILVVAMFFVRDFEDIIYVMPVALLLRAAAMRITKKRLSEKLASVAA